MKNINGCMIGGGGVREELSGCEEINHMFEKG
jgi:hypothetical protein